VLPKLPNPVAQDWITTFKSIQDTVSKTIAAQQERMKRNADVKRSAVEFAVGDSVLLDSRNLNLAGSTKLKHRYVGPFPITRMLSPLVCELQLPSHLRLHNRFHVSLLKHYLADEVFPDHTAEPPPAPVLVDNHTEYFVEALLAKRGAGKRAKYLVRWLGYGPEHDSWLPYAEVCDLEAFENFACT
jgi:hypothetical protein